MSKNPKTSYFDKTSNKNVCIVFEETGYCKDLGACKFYHRQKGDPVNFFDDEMNFKPKLPEPVVFPLPYREDDFLLDFRPI